MAHGDYHCCAICDCKLDYAAYDSRTKEDICVHCLRAAHLAGIPVYTGSDLASWITQNPESARSKLEGIGFSKCFYRNSVDEAFEAVVADTQAGGGGA